MRLVCPNCDAQYEVDDAAIPAAGRDVQCSNCGHTWFQRHPQSEADEALEDEIFVAEDEAASANTIADEAETPDASTDEAALAEPMMEVSEEAPAAPTALSEGADAPQRRRALDESLMAVLREEAEREAAVRKAEAPSAVEMQPELGLPAAPPVPPSVVAARERFADLSVEAVEHEAEDAARPASRRELLPDIEEINSTLRASSEPRGDGERAAMPMVMVDEGRRGFRSGFTLMLILAAALWMAYVMSPRIVAQIPASEGAMRAYVAAVDKARISVDAALQSASESLRSMSGQGG